MVSFSNVLQSWRWRLPKHYRISSCRSVSTLLEKYDSLLGMSNFRRDEHQVEVLKVLERLRNDWIQREQSTSWFSEAPRGVYVHGGVGCGKTFCMNLFYDMLETENKQKVHFHKFMLSVHQEMHQARKANPNDDILPTVTDSVLSKGAMICFDEFQVTDVADAMILQRLFEGLWKRGAVVVTTSNRPPDDLYENGIQRDRFLPFVELLKQRCEVLSMAQSETDYRLVQKQASGNTKKPVHYIGREARREFDRFFFQVAGENTQIASTKLSVGGRHVSIPRIALSKRLARFTFADLCQKALGAADYLVIGQEFDTVFVENIPLLTVNELNWVRRFITFVDSMYECQVKLVLQLRKPIDEIFESHGEQFDEVFAFDRTVSRLHEMSSESYLSKARQRRRARKEPISAKILLVPSLGDESRKGRSTSVA